MKSNMINKYYTLMSNMESRAKDYVSIVRKVIGKYFIDYVEYITLRNELSIFYYNGKDNNQIEIVSVNNTYIKIKIADSSVPACCYIDIPKYIFDNNNPPTEESVKQEIYNNIMSSVKIEKEKIIGEYDIKINKILEVSNSLLQDFDDKKENKKEDNKNEN